MNQDNLDKFGFLLGEWNMESRIPKTKFSDPGTDTGARSFKKILVKLF